MGVDTIFFLLWLQKKSYIASKCSKSPPTNGPPPKKLKSCRQRVFNHKNRTPHDKICMEFSGRGESHPYFSQKILVTSARISPIRVINLRRFVPKEGVKSSLQGRINQQKKIQARQSICLVGPQNLVSESIWMEFVFSIDFIFLSQRRVKIIRFCSGDKGYQSSWSIFFLPSKKCKVHQFMFWYWSTSWWKLVSPGWLMAAFPIWV